MLICKGLRRISSRVLKKSVPNYFNGFNASKCLILNNRKCMADKKPQDLPQNIIQQLNAQDIYQVQTFTGYLTTVGTQIGNAIIDREENLMLYQSQFDDQGHNIKDKNPKVINFLWLRGIVTMLEFWLKRIIKIDEFKLLAVQSQIMQTIKWNYVSPLMYKQLKLKQGGVFNAICKTVEDFLLHFCVYAYDLWRLFK